MDKCQALLKRLASNNNEEIRDAAFAAAEENCHEAVPVLARHIRSDNLGVQEAAEMALRKIGGPEAVHEMIPLLRSDDPPVRNIAMDILRDVGGSDIDAVVQLLEDKDVDLRIFATDILGALETILVVSPLCNSLLSDPEVNVRYQAAVSLGNLPCPEAAKCLNKALGDEEWVVFAVIEALTKIRDDSSISALADALDHSSDLVASMIVEALGVMGNIKAAKLLLTKLDNSNVALRNKMIKSLLQIMGGKSLSLFEESQRERFRDYLLLALEDEDTSIQDAAVQGLSAMGGEQAAAAVFDFAVRLDSDHDAERHQRTIEALAAMGHAHVLEEAVRHGDDRQAYTAVSVMGAMPTCVEAPLLMDIFWEKDRDLQRLIIDALGNFCGETAADFFMDVLKRHNDEDILKCAIHFLGNVLKKQEAGEMLFSLLEHPFDEVKEAALEACIALGGDSMLRRFKSLAGSPDPLQRLMAVYALGSLVTAEDLELLHSALEDEVPDIRKVALEALCRRFNGSAKVLDILISRLNDENRDVRLSVVELLGHSPLPEASRPLLAALGDEDAWVQLRAVEALGERRHKEAVQPLLGLLHSDNPMVVIKVAEALGKIGGTAAFKALMDLAEHEEPEIQAAVTGALEMLHSQGEDR